MSVINAKWKPVPIDRKLFAEGLIGIEECTEYGQNEFNKKGTLETHFTVVDNSTVQKKKRKTDIQKKKRKTDIQNQPKKKQKIEENDFRPSQNGNTSKIEETCVLSEVEQCNLDAWASFGFPSTILRAIGELGFSEPTAIQKLTLPPAVLGRKDIVGAAETGSGKTLAFGLPILMGILRLKEKQNESSTVNDDFSDESEIEDSFNDVDLDLKKTANLKPLYALILTPTRELAIQIKNHITAVAKYTGINVVVIVGGMAAVKQERILSKGPEIVVATPGRLWELIQHGNLHLSQIDNIRFLAIDETDRMLEKGHFQELNDLLERINLDKDKLKERQNFVFSATLTLVHDLPNYLKNKGQIKSKKVANMTPEQKLKKIVDALGLNDPKIVDLSEGKGTSETLTESRITCRIDEKDLYLFYFIKRHPGRTLVFCNSIGCVKRLTALLTLLNCHPLPLHASMQQRQRLKNIERFSSIENSILIATDVAARGLDIPQIDHVLHYQTPRTSENYVHRSGRTARASREGISVVFIEPTEIQRYIKLCRTLGKGEDMPIFPVQDNILNSVKKMIKLAREVDKLQLQVKKANSEMGWLQKAADDMDVIVDDFSRKYDTKETQSYKKLLDFKKKQLTSLLSMPIIPKGFSGKHPLYSSALGSFNEVKNNENALDLVKGVAPKNSQERNKNRRLYKPKNQEKPTGHSISYKLTNTKRGVEKNRKNRKNKR